MKAKIMILSYMRYVKKDKTSGTETPMTRIEFIIDELQESKNSCGYKPIACFYKGHDVYNKLSKGLLKRELDAEFEIKPDLYDPSSLRRMLKKINGNELY